jgi:hypothetical protein
VTETVKVHIDISTGNVGIECSEAAFDAILNRVADFVPKLATLRAAHRENADPPKAPGPARPTNAAQTEVASTRASRRKQLPVYKMTDLGTDDDTKRSFKKHFESKGPKNQKDQLLLCAFWLNKTLRKDTFTDDDIFTALRTAGAPKIPPRIESVISNLKLENKLAGERGKYRITHIGEDFVNNDPPLKGATA